MINGIIEFVRSFILFAIVIWIAIAYVVFVCWKDFYYYPTYDLYIYADGGIVGNRTILLGEDPDRMNTCIRYDSKDCFSFYISKAENHFYIYWPEDTTTIQYKNVMKQKTSIIFSHNLEEVKYNSCLREFYSDDASFSLEPYIHQTPENWIETFETWSDSIHWGQPGQIKISQELRLSALNPNENLDFKQISIKDCGLLSYSKVFFRALDSTIYIFVSIFLLYVFCYYFLGLVMHKNRKNNIRE